MYWGTLMRRRTSVTATGQGGWSCSIRLRQGWSCSIRPSTIRSANTAATHIGSFAMPGSIDAVPLDNIAHVIQVALTPVFLLSGIGALLNVFNTRLARVSDHVSHTAELLAADPQGNDSALMRRHIRRLRCRVLALDAAIVLGALGGATTCGAAFTLFVGALRNANTAFALFLLFGSALGCTVAALGVFIVDGLLAWHGLRKEGPLPAMQRQ
jgi:hypothetical protein